MKRRCENPLTRPPDHEDSPSVIVDGRIHASTTWCYMCVACHQKWGVGLGTGRGQKYEQYFNQKTGEYELKKIEG